MLDPAVALAMPGEIGRAAVADRRRRGAPEIAALDIAHVDDFARAVDDGIVRPWRQLVLPTIGRPRVAGALRRHLEAERGIGDDVDPGCGRPLAAAEDRHIFPPLRDEASQTVEELGIG